MWRLKDLYHSISIIYSNWLSTSRLWLGKSLRYHQCVNSFITSIQPAGVVFVEISKLSPKVVKTKVNRASRVIVLRHTKCFAFLNESLNAHHHHHRTHTTHNASVHSKTHLVCLLKCKRGSQVNTLSVRLRLAKLSSETIRGSITWCVWRMDIILLVTTI